MLLLLLWQITFIPNKFITVNRHYKNQVVKFHFLKWDKWSNMLPILDVLVIVGKGDQMISRWSLVELSGRMTLRTNTTIRTFFSKQGVRTYIKGSDDIPIRLHFCSLNFDQLMKLVLLFSIWTKQFLYYKVFCNFSQNPHFPSKNAQMANECLCGSANLKNDI